MSRTARACDVCLKVRNDVKVYSLVRAEQKDSRGVVVEPAHGAGAVDMCDPCWERIASHRRKPARASRGPCRSV